MTRRIEATYVCEDSRGQRHVVLQFRHFWTFTFGGRRWEVPMGRELVLEGDSTGCGVAVLKAGRVFQVVHDRTILRRIDWYQVAQTGPRAPQPPLLVLDREPEAVERTLTSV